MSDNRILDEMAAATEDTTPVADTTAGEYSWSAARRAVAITNDTGVAVYIKFNNSAAASTSNFDLLIQDDTCYMGTVAEIGLRGVKTLSVWVPAGGTVAGLNIVGV